MWWNIEENFRYHGVSLETKSHHYLTMQKNKFSSAKLLKDSLKEIKIDTILN